MKLFWAMLCGALLVGGCAENTSPESVPVSGEEKESEATAGHPKLGDYFEDFQDFYVFEYENRVEGKGEMFHNTFAYAAENPYNKIKTGTGAKGAKVLDLEMSATASEEDIWPTLIRHIPNNYEYALGTITEDGEAFHLKFDSPNSTDHISIMGTTLPTDGEETFELTLTYSVDSQSSRELLYRETSDVAEVTADGHPDAVTYRELMVMTEEQVVSAIAGTYNGEENPTLVWDDLTAFQQELVAGFIYPCRGQLPEDNPDASDMSIVAYSDHLRSAGDLPMEVMSFLYTLEQEGEQFAELGCAIEAKPVSNEENLPSEEAAVQEQTKSGHPTLGATYREIEEFYGSYDHMLEESNALSENEFLYAAENPQNVLRVNPPSDADKEVGKLEVMSSVTDETVWTVLTRHIPSDYELVYGHASNRIIKESPHLGSAFTYYFSNYETEPPYSYIKVSGQFGPHPSEEEKVLYRMNFTISKEEDQVIGALLTFKEEVDERAEKGMTLNNQRFFVTSEEDIIKTISGGYEGEESPTIQWSTLSDQQKMLFIDFINPCSDPTSREYTLKGYENYSNYLSEEVQGLPKGIDHFVLALQAEKEQFENMGCGF